MFFGCVSIQGVEWKSLGDITQPLMRHDMKDHGGHDMMSQKDNPVTAFVTEILQVG